jgi:hypothetical protein
MSSKDCPLAPWEQEYERERIMAARTHFTKQQWRAKGRWVVVSDEEAPRVTVTRNGRTLYLFSEDQTEEARQ